MVYSVEASGSKEYRRETKPGHTEIMVEKFAITPMMLENHNKKVQYTWLPKNDSANDDSVMPNYYFGNSSPNDYTTNTKEDTSILQQSLVEQQSAVDREKPSLSKELVGEVVTTNAKRPPIHSKSANVNQRKQRHSNGKENSEKNVQQDQAVQKMPRKNVLNSSDFVKPVLQLQNEQKKKMLQNLWHHDQKNEDMNSEPNSVIFVTVAPVLPHESKYEEDSEIAVAASETKEAYVPKPFTFVEIQKSINVRNKLITEQGGRLLEQHETIYHDTEDGKQYPQQIQTTVQNYDSLSTNPINVQPIEFETENKPTKIFNDFALPQPKEKPIFEPYRTVTEEKENHKFHQNQRYIGSNFQNYADHNINQVYPVQDVFEKHINIPYLDLEAVAMPVHHQHYTEGIYPVETIVQKPIPYPVEKVVEKVVEKHIPIEVERIVEMPVEKVVEKFIDRPVAIPIHVPVAFSIPMMPLLLSDSYNRAQSNQKHPNSLGLMQPSPMLSRLPTKVLQNYYMRMLKKLLPQKNTINYETQTKTSQIPAKLSDELLTTLKPAIRVTDDTHTDLKPPPPPEGSNWYSGSRYKYNTLPHDLAATATASTILHTKQNMLPLSLGPQQNDEFQRWRNGHALKRSPDNGHEPHLEYGFKPPLVPSVEINDQGIPLNSDILSPKQ